MKRREFFRIQKFARRYDRSSGKFIVDIAYTTATEVTQRTIAVSEAFGLGVDQTQKFPIYDNVELKIGPKDIVLITGDSGSGKSVLLRALAKDIQDNPELGGVINIADVEVDQDKPLIETVGKTVEEGLELLSRVGLNDAFLFVRRFKELSDGQRYRYRLPLFFIFTQHSLPGGDFTSFANSGISRIFSMVFSINRKFFIDIECLLLTASLRIVGLSLLSPPKSGGSRNMWQWQLRRCTVGFTVSKDYFHMVTWKSGGF